MTFWSPINNVKMLEWGLSLKAAYLFTVFADLESWADRVVVAVNGEPQVYYKLFRAKIKADLPILGSLSTISRLISDLEECGLIESTTKFSTPSYRLTAKGMTWKLAPDALSKKETPTGAGRKQSRFSLGKLTGFEDLSPEYFKMLHEEAQQMCDTTNVNFDEFELFISHHASKGSKFINWKAAFNTWIRKLKKIAAAREDGRGLYR